MKTFADKAKAIQRKYPHADRVSADYEAMMSELRALHAQQEQAQVEMKQQTGADRMYADGGGIYAKYLEDFGDPSKWMGPMTWDDLHPTKITYDDLDDKTRNILKRWEPTGDTVQFGENVFPEVQGSIADIPSSPATTESSSNASILNMAEGITGALTNVAAMADLEDPKRITPQTVNPSFQYRPFDITPFQTDLRKQMDSTRYSFMESGADFDTVSAKLNQMNDTFARRLGTTYTEGQQINNQERARGDAIVNQALYYNADQMTQSKIDQAARQDIIDQRRRDYIVALGQNISNIFRNEADRNLAESLDSLYGRLGYLTGIQQGSKGR